MRSVILAIFCVIAIACATQAQAESSLSIRLVQASNQAAGVAGALGDVAELLKTNLPFDTFTLLSSKTLGLPAAGQVGLGNEFTVSCQGTQRSLSIRVSRGGEKVLDTTVSLQSGIPLILGGFPAKPGKMILILLAN